MSTIPAEWNEQVAYLISERAYLLHTEGRFQESLSLFEGLSEIDPENLYVRDAISALYLSLGNPPETIRHASRIIASAPNYTNAFLRRCEAYLLLGMSEEAKEDLERLRELGAHRQAQRMEMRWMAVRKKQTVRTKKHFNKLLTRASNPQLYGIEKR
jgi:tetratricopeptide (TPR) repeat protein